MRHRGLWLALGAGAAMLGACSTVTAPRPMADLDVDLPMRWGFHNETSTEGVLVYGTPNTDNVGIIFSCGRRATSVRFATDLDKGAPGPGVVRFRSGKAKGQYAAKLERSEMTDGWVADGFIKLPDPVLSAFEQTGRISQVEDQAYPQDARAAAERENIKRFFGFCRG
jgi:hypothetical protein